VFVRENAGNGIWYPMSPRSGSDGAVIALPHLTDRQKPGFLVVDPEGRRFDYEGISYQTLGRIMHERAIDRAWLIGGYSAVRRFGIGMALPQPFPIGLHVKSSYVIKGRRRKRWRCGWASTPQFCRGPSPVSMPT
jgi:hypothetical protein